MPCFESENMNIFLEFLFIPFLTDFFVIKNKIIKKYREKMNVKIKQMHNRIDGDANEMIRMAFIVHFLNDLIFL